MLYGFTHKIILYYFDNDLVEGFCKLWFGCNYCVNILLYTVHSAVTVLFVPHGSLALLQDVQMAVANQGWSFIKFNRVSVLYAYVRKPVFFLA